MKFLEKTFFVLKVILGVLISSSVLSQSINIAGKEDVSFSFFEKKYVHRWSKNNQNEYTPVDDSDLSKWRSMVTINIFESTKTAEQLAMVANNVLGNYEKYGSIIKTNSKPRTSAQEAEHLVVARLADKTLQEAVFARFVMSDDVGFVLVYSYRIYGKDASTAMGNWLKENGAFAEKNLMAWNDFPKLKTIKKLPQAK